MNQNILKELKNMNIIDLKWICKELNLSCSPKKKNMIKKTLFTIIFFLIFNQSFAKENIMILKLKDGDVIIELFNDIAPNHVERFKKLSSEKKYDGVVFHRVIDGFMAQTGDVQFGNSNSENYDLSRAGTGSSEYPDLKAEFSELPHERGTLSLSLIHI